MLQVVDCNAILKGRIARKSPRLMYQRKREECDITSEMFRRIRRPPAGLGKKRSHWIVFIQTKSFHRFYQLYPSSSHVWKKTRLFKRVQNLFCFSCVKMISVFLIFPWLCFTLKPLQHVVHTPLQPLCWGTLTHGKHWSVWFLLDEESLFCSRMGRYLLFFRWWIDEILNK